MKPTLQTVADLVGVSRSTVSNAYSRPDQLSAGLRDRILSAAKTLGYSGPNATARSLRRGRAGAIGVLFTAALSYAFIDPYAVRFLRGLAESAERHDTGLLLIPLAQGDAGAAEQKIHDAVVDGFCVYCVPEWHDALPVVHSRGLPVVTTQYRQKAGPDDLSVGIDDRAAARAAAAHIVKLGHRRIAILSVISMKPDGDDAEWDFRPPEVDDIPEFEMRQRLSGYRDAITAAGIDFAEVTVVNAASNSRTDGTAAAGYALDQADRPTAVLASTDLIALGALDALAARGLRAGLDVSVTGFDDIPEAATTGLTTVRQPAIDKGVIAGELLLDPPDEEFERHVLLPTDFIVRATTGPVKRT